MMSVAGLQRVRLLTAARRELEAGQYVAYLLAMGQIHRGMTLPIVVALKDVDVPKQVETLHHVFPNELTPPSQRIYFIS
jgi:hypothetical protein